ncbi:WD40 repeat-like protein [Wallemia mellicola]|uniref:WD40 repeat-like protein n=1 Tax=Wallemia mellicola TaxID=1708541 RepID=A0A4T0NRU4_9BASI|nr:WD40 repeat-like protein [Wallemia mellicola]TIC04555.1 WD40 repeat-like protein [Wallemia mellicola]
MPSTLSNILGWSYVTSWCLSFYPQLIVNYKRKRVDGVSIDFLYLNVLGFLCLTIYNLAFLYSDTVKEEYKARHNGNDSTVQFNDALFAMHAFTLSVVGVIQSLVYPRSKSQQSVSITSGTTIWVVVDGFFVLSLFVYLGWWSLELIDLLYFLSGVKLYVTVCKYVPQMLHNYRRKSTVGFSIFNILFDFVGGFLSLLQLIVDSVGSGDLTGIIGNPIKLSLSLVTLVFDIIFMTMKSAAKNADSSNELTPTEEIPGYTSNDSGFASDEEYSEYGTTPDHDVTTKMDPAMMEMMGFSGFGKKKTEKKSAISERLDNTKRSADTQDESVKKEENTENVTIESTQGAAPEIPQESVEIPLEIDRKPKVETEKDTNEGDKDDEDEEYETDRDPIPSSHEVVLQDHSKAATAIDLDPAGSRLASGSHDYDIKLWDFAAMNTAFRPFRSFEGCETNHIHDLKYSINGDSILAASGQAIPRLFTRDGDEIYKWSKGDQYIKDQRQTKGHIGEINNCAWHPFDYNLFITCSADSTVRIWDVTEPREQKHVLVFKSKERGTKTKVTACAYSPDGKFIVAVGYDGAMHLWSTAGNYARPNAMNDAAHTKHSWTSSVCFTPDSKYIVTRGGDDTVKLWDVKNIKRPVHVASNLPSLYQEVNATFSPDGKYVLTGVAGVRGESKASVVVLLTETLAEVKRIPIGKDKGGCVIRTLWHSRINQIIATHSDGGIYVLYDPMSSIRGALMPLDRAPKRARDVEDVLASTDPDRDLRVPIITPDAMEEDERTQKRMRMKKESDARKPQPPLVGSGRGGRVGASATQAMVQRLFGESTIGQDPREELLKYADVDNDPKWTGAWKESGRVYDGETEEQMKERKRKEKETD